MKDCLDSELSSTEEQELAVRIQEGDLQARDRLAMSQYRWMCDFVRKIYGKSGVDVRDLRGHGAVSLLMAASRFRPGTQARFRTVAHQEIRMHLSREVHRETRIVRKPLRDYRYGDAAVHVSLVGDWDDSSSPCWYPSEDLSSAFLDFLPLLPPAQADILRVVLSLDGRLSVRAVCLTMGVSRQLAALHLAELRETIRLHFSESP